jgi:hypothetical protein
MRTGALRGKSGRKGGTEEGWGKEERGEERGRKGKVEEIAESREVRGEKGERTLER